MKKLLIILGLVFSVNANAELITAKATGVATTQDEALEIALKNAVKENSGVIVTEEQNAKVEAKFMFNSIKADFSDSGISYRGKIESYKVISSEKEGENFVVTIEAKMKDPNKVNAYKAALESGKKPKLAIMDLIGVESVCSTANGEPDFSIANDFNMYLTNALVKSDKFKVLDRKNFDKYADELYLIAENLAAGNEVSKASKISVADYLLVPEVIDFKVHGESIKLSMTGEEYNKAKTNLQINYRLIELATMEIVESNIVSYSASRKGKVSCGPDINKTLDKISKKLVKQLLAKLYNSKMPAEKKPVEEKEKTKTSAKREMVLLPYDK